MNKFDSHLTECKTLHVQQLLEGFEVIFNWETRNKYKILDEHKNPIAFAAEQSDGILGALVRQFLGHWRSFKVSIFTNEKEKLYDLHFPFRWFFKTLFLKDHKGEDLGHLQQRFALFHKRFDVHDKNGRIIAKINSSYFKFWTFKFFHQERPLGMIQKRWSGALTELFTDRDDFVITYEPNLPNETKALMLATCLMVDIIYFENRKR